MYPLRRTIMSRRRKKPLKLQTLVHVPLAAICRKPGPWHTRIVAQPSVVQRLARAIQKTGLVVPITVVQIGPGLYAYVTGLLRILAAEALGHTEIPAIVLPAGGDETLLLAAVAAQEAHVPLTTLERGWALERLLDLRLQAGRFSKQAQIALEVGLSEGDLSLALRAAKAIPVAHAEALSGRYGITAEHIASLSRSALRVVARAPAEHRDRLLGVACEALARGDNATEAVGAARTAGAAAAAQDKAEKEGKEQKGQKEQKDKEGKPKATSADPAAWGVAVYLILAGLRIAMDCLGRRFVGWARRLPWAARASPAS
jgi:ParB-like chromosome segregation protein Spo0J